MAKTTGSNDIISADLLSGKSSSYREALLTAFHKLKRANKNRVKRRDDLDQCPATIATVLRRLMLILQEDIEHKSILLLGDDDLMSIALSAANVTCQITVVDFDEALLELIASNTDSSRARTFLWDLRKPLPLSFEKQYDFVLTDPPYTIDGQLTFLRQAILALRPAGNSTLLFCASRLYLCENRLQEIFAFLANSSLRCAEAYENFNEYEAPPDVLQDMRRLDPESMATTFHSTLFRYIAGSTPIRLAAINPIPGNIYSYDQNNVTS